MLFSWLFSNTDRQLQTYFTLEFQFYYCCWLFIIVSFCIYLLPLVVSLRTKPQTSGCYPDTWNSEVTGKSGGRTGFKCRMFLVKRQVFWLNLYIYLRRIRQVRTDSEHGKLLYILIYTNQKLVSVCRPLIRSTRFQYLYNILAYWY